MKKIVLLVMFLSLLSGGGVFGWHWWTEGRFVETTDDAYVHADSTPVAAKLSGYVRAIHAVENRPVRVGDPLVEIDDADYAARLTQARAAVTARRAAVETVRGQTDLQTLVVRQAVSQIAIAKAEVERTNADRDRYAQLAKTSTASRQSYDHARSDYDKAVASLHAAEAAVATERGRMTVLAAQLKEAEQAIVEAEAAVRIAELDVENTRIVAPVDGIVGNRTVTVGQYVRAGTQLMVVVPIRDVYVEANFKETQIAHMVPGQQATLEFDAFPDHPVTGVIESFSPATGSRFSLLPPENATGNFTKIVQRVPVRIRLPQGALPDGAVRPGMSVIVGVDTRNGGQTRSAMGSGLSAAAAELPAR